MGDRCPATFIRISWRARLTIGGAGATSKISIARPDLHHNAHRLSVEWSRIEPERGKFNGAALDHYNQMIAALRERGMEPLVTLHHFTNPLWVEAMGGWTNIETVRRYERFVAADRGRTRPQRVRCGVPSTSRWFTPPRVICWGSFPPGHRNLKRTLSVAENMLRGHAAAYRAIKKIQPERADRFCQTPDQPEDAQTGAAAHSRRAT